MNGFCDAGSWGVLGDFGVLGWIGLVLNLIFWVGLIAGLSVLVILAIRRAQAPTGNLPPTAGGQNSAKEILQARYARGEISREQYELRKQDIG